MNRDYRKKEVKIKWTRERNRGTGAWKDTEDQRLKDGSKEAE